MIVIGYGWKGFTGCIALLLLALFGAAAEAPCRLKIEIRGPADGVVHRTRIVLAGEDRNAAELVRVVRAASGTDGSGSTWMS